MASDYYDIHVNDLTQLHRQVWSKIDTNTISGKLTLNTLQYLGRARHDLTSDKLD